MRRFLPQTLPVWVLLIVIAGLLINQIATLAIVSRDRAAAADVVNLYRLNERAYSTVQLLHLASPDERKTLASGLSNTSFALTVTDTPEVTSAIPADDELAELEDILVGRLSKFGITDARVRRDAAGTATTRRAPLEDKGVGDIERGLLRLAAKFEHSDKLTASLRFANGQWVNLTQPNTPVGPVLNLESLPFYGLVAALVIITSIWSIRRLTAPYRMMETAVNRIGADLKSAPIAETGSREIRAAAKAVNAMQARLRAYVEDREHLAVALAHDLRIPLTRMRLRLELMRNSAMRKALAHDLAEVEGIAGSVIDFATFGVADEKPERIDLLALAEAVADGFAGASFSGDVEEMSPRDFVCVARPVALKRCISNLVQNAIAYGKAAHLSLSRSDKTLTLTVRDEGPGMPADQLEQMFAPFVRHEPSRSRQTGGLGLGLTIARNIARGAGGDVTLANHPEGGMVATLTLPRG